MRVAQNVYAVLDMFHPVCDVNYVIPRHGRLCDTKEIPKHITHLKELIAKA